MISNAIESKKATPVEASVAFFLANSVQMGQSDIRYPTSAISSPRRVS